MLRARNCSEPRLASISSCSRSSRCLARSRLASVGSDDVLDRDLGQPLGRHLGVVLELAVAERGDPPVLLEPAAHLGEVDRREVEQEAEAAGQVGQLAVDREVVGGELGGGHAAPHASSPSRRGTDGFERGGQLVEVVVVGRAGPLVHEDLLELDGERAAASRGSARAPAGTGSRPRSGRSRGRRARWPATTCCAEVAHEPVHDVAPPVPVERTRADVDLRVLLDGLRRTVGAVAAVVVRVDVEHDERALAGEVVEEAVEHGVERVVQAARALDLLLGERLAPHLEAPRGVRRPRTRTGGAAG